MQYYSISLNLDFNLDVFFKLIKKESISRIFLIVNIYLVILMIKSSFLTVLVFMNEIMLLLAEETEKNMDVKFISSVEKRPPPPRLLK